MLNEISPEIITKVVGDNFESFFKNNSEKAETYQQILDKYFEDNCRTYSELLDFIEVTYYQPYFILGINADQLFNEFMIRFHQKFYADELKNSFFRKVFRDKFNRLDDIQKFLFIFLMKNGNDNGFNPLPNLLFDNEICLNYFKVVVQNIISRYLAENPSVKNTELKIA
jgi:hypothetical protein